MTPYTVKVGNIEIGADSPARVMGVVNLSSESFYSESVVVDEERVNEKVQQMEKDGVDIIDVGGASTAPEGIYNTQQVSVRKSDNTYDCEFRRNEEKAIQKARRRRPQRGKDLLNGWR